MTHIWQRRALATAVLFALLGIGIVLGSGAGNLIDRPSAAVSSAADHSAFASLPDPRQTLGYVEPLALLGFGLVLAASLLDHHLTSAPVAIPAVAVRRRRWRAQLEGAPPIHS